jgi:hypothetical protein
LSQNNVTVAQNDSRISFLGSKVSRITVAKYMNQPGFTKQMEQGYTNSKHNLNYAQCFKQGICSNRLGFDITYIRVKKDSCI